MSTFPCSPGPWAIIVKALDWPYATEANMVKTPLLRYLLPMPAQREPAIRLNRLWTGRQLNFQPGMTKYNPEAFLAQTNGDLTASAIRRPSQTA
jgi:hypothetical protein